MGEAVYKKEFTEADHQAFSLRLEQQLNQLRDLVEGESFRRHAPSIGAELEMYLVDNEFQPACVNEELLRLAEHPQLTPELNQYNLEFNLTPVSAIGAPFSEVERELREFLDMLQAHANGIGANILPIGILPTLREEHLQKEYMTDRDRYHALTRGLCGAQGDGFHINIHGEDQLTLQGEGVTPEGANTSFQVHLRLPAQDFAHHFNAAQLTTPFTLALGANSPLIAGHRLWQETRIALFKQSIDFRERAHPDWRQPARVSFGNGWAREGAWELFAENVALYKPIIPMLFDEEEGDPPPLRELCLHHGTVWPWNRAVYGASDGGHLRIEFRSLPAGPTVIDMLANAALSIGWTMGLRDAVNDYASRLPLRFAEYNFYRAAQYGLDARLIWPRKHVGGLVERPIVELIEEFLPRAREGLVMLGVDNSDIDRLWQVIEQRVVSRRTGAAWQLEKFEHYRESFDVEESCRRMLAEYVHNLMVGDPVASWC